tara:strand:- start:2338 stop:3681 length:1344 start_codon:yes stop_codon:yes gene_type:complete
MIVLLRILPIIGCLFLWSCATTGNTNNLSDNSQKTEKASSLSDEDIEECRLYQSYQYDYWKNRNYRRVVYCNMYMMEMNCDESIKYPVNYYNLSRSFIDLDASKIDSAFWALKQGLRENPENETLLELGAYLSKKSNNIDQQIYYLDKVISINESNPRALEQLCDVYGDQERFEDQVLIIDLWLKLDLDEMSYRKAIGEKKQAYQALGEETSDVDKERWQSDPSNLQYGFFFLQALDELENYDDLISYADEVLMYDSSSGSDPLALKILELKASSYLTLYDNDMAKNTYEELYLIDNNYKYAIEISKILVDEEKYSDAYSWSEKSIAGTTGVNDNKIGKGESYFQRAEVLYSSAQSCQDPSGELNFWDKIVYDIALEDYEIAYDNGQYNAATRKKFLSENYISSPSDWFLNASDVKRVCPNCKNDKVVPTLKECYSFIDRTVETKVQ